MLTKAIAMSAEASHACVPASDLASQQASATARISHCVCAHRRKHLVRDMPQQQLEHGHNQDIVLLLEADMEQLVPPELAEAACALHTVRTCPASELLVTGRITSSGATRVSKGLRVPRTRS